ncbi:hypothetical protein FM036_32845 [Nostoc sp. HG1]|nr:hypothetical protein [Nostoc sp. HG1]
MSRLNFAAIAAPVLFAFVSASPVVAQNYPLTEGDYTEVSMVEIQPGGGYDYALQLAGQWRKSQEFAKAQGWIKDYKVMSNVHGRDGEPDLYLMVTMASMPSPAESERRAEAYRKFMATTDQQSVQQSGDRAKMRKLAGNMLLQELRFK